MAVNLKESRFPVFNRLVSDVEGVAGASYQSLDARLNPNSQW